MGIKIDLGAGNPAEGENQAQGYMLQDIEAHPGIELVCDIRDLGGHLEPGSVETFRASHVLEHFSRKELHEVLVMLYNLLQLGGTVEITVPNFRYHAQLVLQGDEEQGELYAFGGQLDEWDYHKVGLTPLILTKYLEKAGFSVKDMVEHSCVICTAFKI